MKACAKVMAIDPASAGKWTAEGCVGVSKEEENSAYNFRSDSRFKVIGGTLWLRNRLTAGATGKLQQFLNAANRSDQIS